MPKLVIVAKRKRTRRNPLVTAPKPLESEVPQESRLQKRASRRPIRKKLPPLVGAGFDLDDLRLFLDPPKRGQKKAELPKVLDGNGVDLSRSDPEAYRAILKQRGIV